MEKLGAAAWATMRPDNPDFSFATSFYELRDVPRQLRDHTRDLIGTMKKSPKWARRIGLKKAGERSAMSKSGEYYLALEFGWLPLLGDIQKFAKTQASWQGTLSKLIRDEGKPRRRRTSANWRNNLDGLDGQTEWSEQFNYPYGGGLSPSHVTQMYKSGQRASKVHMKHVSSNAWAMGRFRFILPPGPRNVVWTRKMRRRIFGARVTPSVVYQAMPWSWLIDYFTDLGQFLKAVSPGVADNLVCDHAYIMATRRSVERSTGTEFVTTSKSGEHFRAVQGWCEREFTWKARYLASPFGFGFKDNLNPKQVAILGALGLSRLP